MASTIKVDKIEGSTGTNVEVPTGQTLKVTDGLGGIYGGTGQTGFAAGDILYANSTTTLTKLVKGTGRQGLQTNSGATAPEWSDSPQSLMTAAGDVLYASGANTLAKLAKGSDDDVLTLASGVPSWASSAGGGKINQVIQTLLTGTTSTVSTSFVDITGYNVAITPTATSSKVMVTISFAVGGNTGNMCGARLQRDIGSAGYSTIAVGTGAGSRTPETIFFRLWDGDACITQSIHYLDSPATTSAVTYKLQWASVEGGATGTPTLNRVFSSTDEYRRPALISTITAWEILA